MKTVIKPDIRYFDEGIQRVIEAHSPAQMRVEIHKAISAEREACAKVCETEARMHDHLDHNGRSRHLDDAAVASTCAAAIRLYGGASGGGKSYVSRLILLAAEEIKARGNK